MKPLTLLFSLFFCSSSSVSLPYDISFAVSLKTFIFCFLLTGPLCFVMLVFTAFYSLELPFMFYRCQQLAAHLKCYHFTVTNCHHLHYSLDVTCAWSPRNLCMKCSINTMSVFLSLYHLFLSCSNKHSYLPSYIIAAVALVRKYHFVSSVISSMKQGKMGVRTQEHKYWVKLSSTTKSIHRIYQHYFPRVLFRPLDV